MGDFNLRTHGKDKRISSYKLKEVRDPSFVKTENPIPLDQLTKNSCRFPHGDVGDEGFGFCGQSIIPGSSYCKGHSDLCYAGKVINKEDKKDLA